MDIFESDSHRHRFLDLLKRYRDECHFTVIAWCLMDNHVHLVLDANDADLSAALQKLATAYAVYYNRAEDRVGHLFQSPFRSKPIEYEEQLVNTVRYVHLNPERAGICPAREYRWSSYSEYEKSPWISNTAMVLGIVGKASDLLQIGPNLDYVVRETPPRVRLSDTKANRLLVQQMKIRSCSDVGSLPKKERNKIIVHAARLNLPPGQLARLFGIGERTVYRVLNNMSRRRATAMTPLKVAKGV